jgi:hypothetical protein
LAKRPQSITSSRAHPKLGELAAQGYGAMVFVLGEADSTSPLEAVGVGNSVKATGLEEAIDPLWNAAFRPLAVLLREWRASHGESLNLALVATSDTSDDVLGKEALRLFGAVCRCKSFEELDLMLEDTSGAVFLSRITDRDFEKAQRDTSAVAVREKEKAPEVSRAIDQAISVELVFKRKRLAVIGLAGGEPRDRQALSEDVTDVVVRLPEARRQSLSALWKTRPGMRVEFRCSPGLFRERERLRENLDAMIGKLAGFTGEAPARFLIDLDREKLFPMGMETKQETTGKEPVTRDGKTAVDGAVFDAADMPRLAPRDAALEELFLRVRANPPEPLPPPPLEPDGLKLQTILRRLQSDPPKTLEERRQFCDDVDTLLDLLHVRFKLADGSLAKLRLTETSRRGTIQYLKSHGSVSGFEAGPPVILVPVPY